MTSEPSDLELKRRVLSLLCEQQGKEILRMDQELKAARAVVDAARNVAPGIANNTQIHYSTIFAEALEAYDKVRGKGEA